MRRLSLPVFAILLAVVIGLVAFHLGASSAHEAGSQAVRATVPSHRANSPSSPPHRGLVPSTLSSPAPAWTAVAEEFVQAFLDKSPNRAARLEDLTTPRLAGLLARTDPYKIPKGDPAGAPQVVDDTGAVITVSQKLSDGSSFAFDLVPDPAVRSGWVVTSARPGDR